MTDPAPSVGNAPASTPPEAPDWQKAVDKIRDTATWIIKAFAALAAVLIGSGPLLVNVSDVTWGASALAAGLGALAALIGVGLVIRWATQVMLPETADLADLINPKSSALKSLVDHVETPSGRSVYLADAADTVRDLAAAIAGWRHTVAELTRYQQQLSAYRA